MLETALTILMISIFSGVTCYAIAWLGIMPGWYYKLKFKPFTCETCTAFHLAWLWGVVFFCYPCFSIIEIFLLLLTAVTSASTYPLIYSICRKLLR